jgi:hypothetical protein
MPQKRLPVRMPRRADAHHRNIRRSPTREFHPARLRRIWPEPGRNLAGTWPEPGWNLAGTRRRRGRDVIRYTNGKELPSRRDGAPESERRRSAMSRRRAWNALSSVFATIRAGSRARRAGESTKWIMRLQPAIILQRTPYTRATPTVPWPYALNTFPPSEALADTSLRKPWEKRSAKSSAETQALCEPYMGTTEGGPG